ncbi:hypothetical protein D3C81_2217330 [compost metagenome]
MAVIDSVILPVGAKAKNGWICHLFIVTHLIGCLNIRAINVVGLKVGDPFISTPF